jgi:hypothetical protein
MNQNMTPIYRQTPMSNGTTPVSSDGDIPPALDSYNSCADLHVTVPRRY